MLLEAHQDLFAKGALAGGWIICNYIGPDRIKMTAAGHDGLEGLAGHFRLDEIRHALIRIGVPTDHGKSEVRDALVTWTGLDVGMIEKGKKASPQEEVAMELPPHSAAVRADDLKRFNLENLRAAVNRMGDGTRVRIENAPLV
ncbi:hypothetical protein MBLNU13_g02568t1 [Cladosporium sp. NU13]